MDAGEQKDEGIVNFKFLGQNLNCFIKCKTLFDVYQHCRTYPLTAPRVKPLIILFWANNIKTTTGISAMFIPAVR